MSEITKRLAIWKKADGTVYRGLSIKSGGRRIFNPTEAQLMAAGYVRTEIETEDLQPQYDAATAYKHRLVALIRLRYDIDDEIGLAANRGDGNADHEREWEEYQQYRAECKAKARAEADAKNPDLYKSPSPEQP